MAGRDGTSAGTKGKDYDMVPVTDSKGKPVLDGKGKPVMTKRYKKKGETTSSSGRSTTTGTRRTSTSSAPSTSKRPQARPATLGAEEAINRSGQGPRTRGGPRRKKEEAPTATSVTTPEVTTTKLPPRQTTLMGYTWEEYKEGNNLGRLRAGLPLGLSRSEFMERAQAAENAPTPASKAKLNPPSGNTRGGGSAGNRAAMRRAKGGLVGYAKGGMVKANCGASMKPTQKSTKKKGY